MSVPTQDQVAAKMWQHLEAAESAPGLAWEFNREMKLVDGFGRLLFYMSNPRQGALREPFSLEKAIETVSELERRS